MRRFKSNSLIEGSINVIKGSSETRVKLRT